MALNGVADRAGRVRAALGEGQKPEGVRRQARSRRGLGSIIMDLNNAEFWRSRAEEARAVAVQMKDPHTKAVMLSIAQDYEKLAERAQRRAGDISPPG